MFETLRVGLIGPEHEILRGLKCHACNSLFEVGIKPMDKTLRNQIFRRVTIILILHDVFIVVNIRLVVVQWSWGEKT